jgi:hypothetical protein
VIKNYDGGMLFGGCGGAKVGGPGYPGWKPFTKRDEGCYDFIGSGGRAPAIKCKTTKECVRTYKTYYKMYKISTYRLYKVCSRCGAEFDYYGHRGLCPRCC